VKPRLYGEEEAASATVLHVLEETLALLHPLMPFVTEEIHGFVPEREGLLAVRPFPVPDEARIDEEAEREIEIVKEAIQQLRRYREDAGAPAGALVPARLLAESPDYRALYERSLPTIERLARYDVEVAEPDGALGESTVAIPGATVDVELDAEAARARRREHVRKELTRAEGKLANTAFVEKAPPEIVQQEREKLERYRRELDDLEG
jgi:valyl-tRNA synthetase